MSEAVTERVISALAKVKRIPKHSVTPESTLESLGLDSLDTITLLFELEDATGIRLPDEQARALRTVRDVVEALRRLEREGAPAGATPASRP